jgi:dihydroorotate dehydrogenase (fumarate)
MTLTTSMMGLRLAHPIVAGASPLGRNLDDVRRLEDGGAAAIVLPSLFEEQITLASEGRIRHKDPLDPRAATVVSQFPREGEYAFTPDEYAEHVRRVRAAVAVPVIGSLNGTTSESWLTFSRLIEQAGADALELNIYEMATDPRDSGVAIETRIRETVAELTRTVRIPIAVKLGPFFTAFGHLARALDRAGADGLVLFNRFYQPDIDVATLTAVPRLQLSTNAELLLRLRWVSALHGHVRCSLAITGGVAAPEDGIKAILAGANAVQLVSAILRQGPGYFAAMRDGLAEWMASRSLASLEQARGLIDGQAAQPDLLERGSYIRTLQSWTP